MKRAISRQLTSLSLSIFFFVLLMFPNKADAQHYFVYQYLKVHPSLESEFLNLELNVWKKMHEKRIKVDVLDGWYFYRLMSPNGTKTEYNYVLIFEYDSPEKLAGHFENYGVDYNEVLNTQEITLALKTPEIRDLVYEEVWLELDNISRMNGNMYRFQVFNAMKLRQDVTADDYQRLEKEYWKPMHSLRIKNGEMAGWGIYNMIIPGGTERAYQWATVDYYDNFIDILANNDVMFQIIHGEKNAATFLEETLNSRDLLRTEVRELIDYTIDEHLNMTNN